MSGLRRRFPHHQKPHDSGARILQEGIEERRRGSRGRMRQRRVEAAVKGGVGCHGPCNRTPAMSPPTLVRQVVIVSQLASPHERVQCAEVHVALSMCYTCSALRNEVFNTAVWMNRCSCAHTVLHRAGPHEIGAGALLRGEAADGHPECRAARPGGPLPPYTRCCQHRDRCRYLRVVEDDNIVPANWMTGCYPVRCL